MSAQSRIVGVNGPSWADVRMMMAEVGAASNVRIDIHCSSAAGVNRAESLVWTCRAWRWGAWGEGMSLAFETGLWPSSFYGTVPGMLFDLLHRLDAKLELMARETTADAQTRMFGQD